jgi:hypothetical protein
VALTLCSVLGRYAVRILARQLVIITDGSVVLLRVLRQFPPNRLLWPPRYPITGSKKRSVGVSLKYAHFIAIHHVLEFSAVAKNISDVRNKQFNVALLSLVALAHLICTGFN